MGATCPFAAGQTHEYTKSSRLLAMVALGSHSEWAPRILPSKSIGGFRRRISVKALASSISAQLRQVITREFGEFGKGLGDL